MQVGNGVQIGISRKSIPIARDELARANSCLDLNSLSPTRFEMETESELETETEMETETEKETETEILIIEKSRFFDYEFRSRFFDYRKCLENLD